MSAPAVLKSLDGLPPVQRCLSDSEIRIGEAARREMAVLGCGGDRGAKEAILVVAEPLTPALQVALRDLRSRVRQRGYDVIAEFRAAPGLVPLIYQRLAEGQASLEGEGRTAAQETFDHLVEQAGELGASDIHLVIRPASASILFRIHGELSAVTQWTRERATEVASCAYNTLAEVRDVTWDPSRRQDANIARGIGGRVHRLRYAHAPLYPDGVHVVLRLLSSGRGFAFAPSLQHLGYDDGQAAAIEAMVAEPSGIVVISGETGSGKSTTLANLMHLLMTREGGGLTILTVEDPPEYEVPGVLQTPVVRSRDDAERGVDPYAEAIRSAMRRDPDLLMIGEIRDLPTAVLAAQAAQSGHPVLTTVHASRALDIVGRLEGLGATLANNPINRALLCAPRFLSGLIHQVLVPVLCEHCSTPFAVAAAAGRIEAGLAARVAAVLDDTAGVRVRGTGCGRCRAGVKGRTVCAEVITPDAELRQLLRDGRDQEAFDYWVGQRAGEGGGYSIWAHALAKLRAGVVAPADLESCLGRLRLESGSGRRPPRAVAAAARGGR